MKNVKFVKVGCGYRAYRDDKCLGFIGIYYNFFKERNYYTVGEKKFDYLKDAKSYFLQEVA